MAMIQKDSTVNVAASALHAQRLEPSPSNDAAVYRLPTDVLSIIFDICAALDPPYLSSLGWVKLSHVSRRWRALTLGLPLLWAQVVCNFSSEAARNVALARSLDVPLSLHFPSSWWSLRSPDREDLLRQLLSRARLISSPDDILLRGSLRLAGLSLPSLEELDIDLCNDFDRPLLAPALQRLHMRTIPWNIAASHLRLLSVTLNSRAERFGPYLGQLPRLLSTSPLLESFMMNMTAHYGSNDAEASITSAVHSTRRIIQGVLTALDQGKPMVEMRHLASMTIEANTRGSPHGQFSALFTTMLWRSLHAPHIEDTRIALSEQFSPLSDLLDGMREHLSSPHIDTLTITYHWPGLQLALTDSNPDDGHCHVFELPSCDRSSFLDAVIYFSRDLCMHFRTLRLISLSSPGPDLYGRIGWDTGISRSDAYSSVEFIESQGPVSLLTRILWMYTFPQLHTITLDVPQHDHHELTGFASELRGRSTKLKRLTLRGRTAYTDETKFAREVHALRLVDMFEIVIDEREGTETYPSHPRVFKANERRTNLAGTVRKSGTVAGRGGTPSSAERRRTNSVASGAQAESGPSFGHVSSRGHSNRR